MKRRENERSEEKKRNVAIRPGGLHPAVPGESLTRNRKRGRNVKS